MKSIRVSDSDTSMLKEFYQTELAKTQERLEHLRGVLRQIDGSGGRRGPGRPPGSSPAKRRGRKRGPGRPKGSVSRGRPAGARTKAAAGPKPKAVSGGKQPRGKWNQFILGTIQSSSNPVQIQTLVDKGMAKFKDKDRKRVQQAINNTATALRKRGILKSVGQKGVRKKALSIVG